MVKKHVHRLVNEMDGYAFHGSSLALITARR